MGLCCLLFDFAEQSSAGGVAAAEGVGMRTKGWGKRVGVKLPGSRVPGLGAYMLPLEGGAKEGCF